jgi:RNA polymerase sigma-70 factor (ECF subfamily)
MRLASSETDNALTNERDLVRHAQGGDREAFAVLVERYWDRLYRWLYHLGRNRHAAEDLAQETFLKAFAALGSFRAGTNFRAWLFRIAYNGFLNQRQAEGRLRPHCPDQLPETGQGPAEQVMSREAVQLVARELDRLPAEFRSAFLLRVDGGMSFREVASVLRIKEETARWRVFKARQKLVEALAPQLDRDTR